jgi:hypothetical protein
MEELVNAYNNKRGVEMQLAQIQWYWKHLRASLQRRVWLSWTSCHLSLAMENLRFFLQMQAN